MDGGADLDSFLAKWRQRWPEWRVAEAFLPAAARTTAQAWLALRQELADAAWAGADPRPGEAKLAWWAEELDGWSRGARRHPLGRVLQPVDAPWAALARTLPALQDARERPADFEEARAQLQPFAQAVAEISSALAAEGLADAARAAPAVATTLLAQRLLDGDAGAVPLQARAMLGDGAGEAPLRAQAAASLLAAWPGSEGLPRTGRIHLALLRARLAALAAGGAAGPLPAWRTLVLAWRAARHSVPRA